MNPRINYEMTEADLVKILDACKPTPAMWGSGGAKLFDSPQENANRAWKELGDRMGFDAMTVQPVEGRGARFFTAVPTETPCTVVETTRTVIENKLLAALGDDSGKVAAALLTEQDLDDLLEATGQYLNWVAGVTQPFKQVARIRTLDADLKQLRKLAFKK